MHRKHDSRARQQKRIAQHADKTDSTSFFNVLTGPELLSVVEDNLPAHRERLYHPTTTLAMFLSQTMNADASCQRAVNEVAVQRTVHGIKPCSTRTGGYCRARQRLPTEMVSALVRATGAEITRQCPSAWKWRGRAVKLVDGTTVTMPDTPANQRDYPQQTRQQAGLGFPIARVVGVICLSSGAVINAAMGPYQGAHSSEHALLRQLLGSFCAGDVMLADRLYCSYFLIAALLARGVDIVTPQHAMRKTDFRKGRRLTARDHVVQWQKPAQKPHWMSAADYAAAPDTLALREVEVGRNALVTTLLCDRVTPKHALKDLYRQRWHVELDLRCIKTVLGMERLSCTTPAMCEKELWVYLLAYNLIRLVMAQSALYANKLPRELSFKHTLQLWSVWSRQQFLSTVSENVTELLTLIAQNTVGKRPGRIEPRCIKRRASSFPLLMKPRGEARQEIKKHGHPKKLK